MIPELGAAKASSIVHASADVLDELSAGADGTVSLEGHAVSRSFIQNLGRTNRSMKYWRDMSILGTNAIHGASVGYELSRR